MGGNRIEAQAPASSSGAAAAPGAQAASPPLYRAASCAMLKRRQMHGAAVLGDFLYVFGGNLEPEGYTDTVEKAPIHPDGSLGAWSSDTPMPSKRAYISNSTLTLNDVVYIVGGLEGDQKKKFNTVLWTRPKPNGELEPWRETAPFGPSGLSNLTVVSTPGYLHVLGGFSENSTTMKSVVSGIISLEGGVAAWEEGPPMPAPLWFHNAVAVSGRVWVWAGLNSGDRAARSNKVYSCSILATGRLGEWRVEIPGLQVPFYTAASASAGNYLMAFCPRLNPDTPTDDLWFTDLNAKGALNPWRRIPTGLPPKLYIAAASDYRRGTIYIPGGRIDQRENSIESVDNRVYSFQLASHSRGADDAQAAAASSATSQAAAGGAAPSGASSFSPTTTPSQFTYMAQKSLSRNAIQGFLTFDQARQASSIPPGKPMILFFSLTGSQPCNQQAEILRDPKFAALSQQAAFAWMEMRDWPQMTQQLGVFRAPTWVFYNPKGAERGRVHAVISIEQIKNNLEMSR